MKQSFWKLVKPVLSTISQDSIINGYLDHPYGLPGVECEKCNTTWGGSRILPYNCPEKFLKRPELKNRWPISGSSHSALRKEIERELLDQTEMEVTLRPGDEFQPCSLSISGPPKADFLWSNLASFCVPDRIKNAFEENRFTGVVFMPVTFKKTGKGKARQLPMKIIDFDNQYEVSTEEEVIQSNSYYELIITGESKKPEGAEIISKCGLCGREEFDKTKRSLKMTTDMWNGEDIFFLNTTLYPIITDRVRQVLEQMKASNIWLERCF